MASGTQRPQGIAPAQAWRDYLASTRIGAAVGALAQRVSRSVKPPSAPLVNPSPSLCPPKSDIWKELPAELLIQISNFLPRQDVPFLARASSIWNDSIAAKPRAVWHPHAQTAGAIDFDRTVDPRRALKLYQTGNIIGETAWKRIGDVGPIPQLSADIANRLESPCPFGPNRRVIDTHLLVYIPPSITKTINDQRETVPVTLRNLPNLIPGARYDYIADTVLAQHGDVPARGRWLLVPKELIPGSRNQPFAQQQALVHAHPGREVPRAVDMVVALFMKQYCSPGTYLLGRDPWSYTRCTETVQLEEGGTLYQLVVGGFSASGLDVDYYRFDHERTGVVGPAEVQALGT